MPPVRHGGCVDRALAGTSSIICHICDAPTNTAPAAAEEAVQLPTQDEPMPVDNNNGAITKEALQDFVLTAFNCFICEGHVRNEYYKLMCPDCSKFFCAGCYSRKQKCPSCHVNVRRNGLVRCLWVEDIMAALDDAISADWGSDGPSQPAIDALKKAGDLMLNCPICLDTVVDAACCPECSMAFCKRCITRALGNSPNRQCPCCNIQLMGELNIVPCRWFDPLVKILDKVLGRPPREIPDDEDEETDDADAGEDDAQLGAGTEAAVERLSGHVDILVRAVAELRALVEDLTRAVNRNVGSVAARVRRGLGRGRPRPYERSG